MRRKGSLFRVVAVLMATPAMPADLPEIAAAPSWVLPAPSSDIEMAPSQAPLQVLLSDLQVRFTAEAVETHVATRVRIQSPEGLQSMGTYTFAWKPDADVLTLHVLSVTQDGQRRDLLGSGDGLTILRREEQLEQATLTGSLTAVLQPPGLKVGDVVDLSYTLRHQDPVVSDQPDGVYSWPGVSVGHSRLRAVWPKNLPVRWRASEAMPAAQPVLRDGWFDLTFEAKDLEPPLQPTGAPPRFMTLRTLETTTYASWSQLSQRLAPLYGKAAVLAADSPLHAEVRRIKAQNATAVERASAALRLVEDEVRYVLLAMNDGGLVPASADETWQRRFGDCKAKTVLLMALLRELGIESAPAAVSTGFGDGMDQRLPAVGLFNHVLVRAIVDGKVYWLDGTRAGDRSITRLLVPAFRWALPLVERGSALVALEQRPLTDPETVRTLRIDAREGVDSPAPFESELVMKGDTAYALKSQWDRVPAANRDEALRAFWREQFRGVELQKTGSRHDDATGELTWTASGTIRMEWDPRYNTYEPHDLGMGYRADYTRPRGTDVEAPYAVDHPVFTRTVETIRLPPQGSPFTLTGSDIDTTVAGREFRRKARVEADVFTAESTYRSIAPEFAASETVEAQRVLLEMSRNDLYLRKPQGYLPTVSELAGQAGKPLDSAQAYLVRGGQMMFREMHEEAIADFTQALAKDPRLAIALAGRANSAMRSGRYEQAAADARAALAIEPRNSMAARVHSFIARRDGRLQESIDAMGPAIETEKKSSDFTWRGQNYLLQGNGELALRDFDAALAAEPGNAQAYALKAEQLRRLGKSSEIPALADAALVAMGRTAQAFGVATEVLLVAGDIGRAKAMVEAGAILHPGAAAALQHARLEESADRVAADLAEVRRRSEDATPSLLAVAGVQVRRGLYAEALQTFVTLQGKGELTTPSANLRAIALWLSGRRTEATEAFTAVRAKVVEAGWLNNLCWDKATFGAALDEALRECDDALVRKSDCGPCLDSRAFVLLRMDRVDESIRAYDTALRVGPLEPSSLYGRGLARLRAGQREEGNRDLDTARALRPAVAEEFRQYGLWP